MQRQSRDDQDSHSMRIVGRAYRTFVRIVDAQLRELGFAMGQLPVLTALKQGTPLPQASLARRAGVEQSSMAQLLNRMERDKLIRRFADPNDGRSRLVALTDLASRRMPQGKAIMDAAVAIALTGFSQAEVKCLAALMQRVNENLDAAAAELAGE